MNAARTMGQARRHLEQEIAKLEQLKEYHQEYLNRFHQAAAAGMSANQLQEYRAFLAKLDEAVRQQEKVVAASQENHSSHKDEWKQKHTRSQALSKVVERYRKEEIKAADRTEQKESDDRSQRSKS